MSEPEHRDLELVFRPDGAVDLAWVSGDLGTMSGRDNLVQALKMRLLVERGELTRLAHPRYGSRVHELIGERLDRSGLELLRRHVLAALRSDPRVAEVRSLTVSPIIGEPGAVGVQANVVPDPSRFAGGPVELEVILDVG
jgi:phage baseplate assembly protein W